MKRFLALTTVLVLAVFPAAGLAHQGNPNFQSEITSVKPEALADGLKIETYNFDDGVRLTNDTGREVVVLGYEEEPYVRISADGLVEVNLNSPTFYQNEDRWANVEIPERADAEADPEWEKVDNSGQYSWHDHRSHYMVDKVPPQVKDESQETKVFDYEIPLEVDGKPVTASGTLTWMGPQSTAFPVLPFIILAGGVLVGLVVLRRQRRRREGEDNPDDGESEAW